MVEVALEHEEAFDRLEKRELDFNTNPSREEWEFARLVCSCLKVLYDSTKIFSGSEYPTADLLFSELCEIHLCLLDWQKSDSVLIQNMADSMMLKFKKYWTECSMILAVAYVLNPGFKLKFVENYYTEIYGKTISETYRDRVVSGLYAIYSEYAPQTNYVYKPSSTSHTSEVVVSESLVSVKAKRMATWYQREGIGNCETKSELDLYLDEPLSPLKELSILDWWKINSPKYPTLSKFVIIFNFA